MYVLGPNDYPPHSRHHAGWVCLHGTQELDGLKARSVENEFEAAKESDNFIAAVETAELEDAIADAKRASTMGVFDGLRYANHSITLKRDRWLNFIVSVPPTKVVAYARFLRFDVAAVLFG